MQYQSILYLLLVGLLFGCKAPQRSDQDENQYIQKAPEDTIIKGQKKDLCFTNKKPTCFKQVGCIEKF